MQTLRGKFYRISDLQHILKMKIAAREGVDEEGQKLREEVDKLKNKIEVLQQALQQLVEANQHQARE